MQLVGQLLLEIDTGDCWPKTNAGREKAKATRGLLKLVFLVGRRENENRRRLTMESL